MKSILDPSFRYTNSVETDLRKTFARIRRDLRKQVLDTSAREPDLARRVLAFRSRSTGTPEIVTRTEQPVSAVGSRDDH